VADAGGLVQPAGIPGDFAEHVRLMIDLEVLALQADLTRVVTFMAGREISNRTYPDNRRAGFAPTCSSHHGKNPEKMAQLAKINHYHMEFFAYALKRLKETRDGEGSVLDTTLVIRGSAFGDSNDHDFMDLPVIVAGRPCERRAASGGAEGHLDVKPDAGGPADLLGVPAKAFGDSTGPLAGLADA